jgi:hypothetical protein
MVQPYHVASRPNVPFDMQVCGKKTAAGAKRAEAERKAVAEAERIVSGTPGRLEGGLCGSTRRLALPSRVPWLTLSCPGCGQYASVDPRTLTVIRAVRSQA